MLKEHRQEFEAFLKDTPMYMDYKQRLGDYIFILCEEGDAYQNRPIQLAYEVWALMKGYTL